MENWAEIRRLHRAEGMPVKAIVCKLGISRNAVRRALASEGPPRYVREVKGSAVDVFEGAIRHLLVQWPDMPATVIAQRIGWGRSMTVLRERVAVLRVLYAPTDPASRTTYASGELVQCDLWFPAVDIPVGHGQFERPPVLVMVSGYSRMMNALMIPSRTSSDLLAGHWELLKQWGAVPRALVWDNEPAVGSWRSGRPKLAEAFEAFRGTLGVRVIQCKPRDPEAKGLVERGNGYLETSFLPGRVFANPADFNSQLHDWLAGTANVRTHRTLACRPVDRFDHDRASMLTLPPVAPVVGWHATTRLPRDHYVRIASNDYSVHPIAIGRMVDVRADLTHVTVSWAGKSVAVHERHWGKHHTITDPEHARMAAKMRNDLSTLRQRSRLDDGEIVQTRSLDVYDSVFGLETLTEVGA